MSCYHQSSAEVRRNQWSIACPSYHVQVSTSTNPFTFCSNNYDPRDGVGDGQIPYVVEHEIAAIQNCFKAAGLDETKLLFTYIIVSKRINTRFFKMGGKPSNPPSGTIVDDVVTLPERYDFFLVSQSVRQGTVNPTSYNVIKDTSGLKPDHIQKLTYKLTHLYYNWPGTVRVPAPCQYAHKLAFLVGESLHREPSEQLEQVLYYL